MVLRVRCLECIDVDDCESVGRAECESGRLDSSFTVGAMGRAVKGHDGRRTEDGDCFRCVDGGVVMFAEEGMEC